MRSNGVMGSLLERGGEPRYAATGVPEDEPGSEGRPGSDSNHENRGLTPRTFRDCFVAPLLAMTSVGSSRGADSGAVATPWRTKTHSDDLLRPQRHDVAFRFAEQALQHFIRVLPQQRRRGVVTNRRSRILDRVRHERYRASERVRHFDLHAAMLHLRIGVNVVEPVDGAARHAGRLEQRDPLGGRLRADGWRERRGARVAVRDARDVADEARISRDFGNARGLAELDELIVVTDGEDD